MKKKVAGQVIKKLPYVGGWYRAKAQYDKNACFPPGHYYSPIVMVDDLKQKEKTIWKGVQYDGINGIDMNTGEQIDLVNEFAKYYGEIPFDEKKKTELRYYFENGFYSYTDAIVLYSFIRYFSPKRIIEIGSGFSSAVMLDTNERFFDNSINLSFIEPFPERLYSLLKESDKKNTEIIVRDAQVIELDYFRKLEKGDILFIDSTHVSKTGSDVNYIVFEILPNLNSGVLIHFHDVFYPFEYPKEWVFMGRNWNEDYLLKAFLMYNDRFKVKLFSHYLHLHHKEVFENMPLAYRNFGGNFWIEKQ